VEPMLRLSHGMAGGRHQVAIELDGLGVRRTAHTEFDFAEVPDDIERVRWYLEDYLEFPADPAPAVAARVERRLAEIGVELFEAVVGTRDGQRLWDRAQEELQRVRVEGVGLPWELLRDPVTDVAVALRARSFVRSHPEPAQPLRLFEAGSPSGPLPRARCPSSGCPPKRVNSNVPFRSVASHLVPGQATFARLIVSARRMTLRSVGSVACRFRQAM
jgi:hypothetical protein